MGHAEFASTDWVNAERALLRGPALDDEACTEIWGALCRGELLVGARCSTGARILFLARHRTACAALDPRARAVAELVGAGLSYKEIAYELRVSSTSVGRAITSACRSLGASDRIELAILSAAFGPGRGTGDRRSGCAAITIDGEDLVVLGASIGDSALWGRLSSAERAVTELALAGHRGATIARLRGARSERTIANQLIHVFRKAGVSGRAELATRLVAG